MITLGKKAKTKHSLSYITNALVYGTSVKLAPHMLKTYIKMVSLFSAGFVLNCAVNFIIFAAIIIEILIF